jgi:multidrug efflux pump subunit AcrA (membrane-fusion protein)
MNLKTVIFLLLAVVSAGPVGCGRGDETVSSKPPARVTGDVTVSKITRSSIADFYEATGTVKAKSKTDVSANLLGRIVSFPVSEGDAVEKGQTLVEIDSRDALAQLRKGQAGLKEAEAALAETEDSISAANAAVQTAEANKQFAGATFNRYKELYDRKSVSGQEYDSALSKLKMANSELDRATAGAQAALSRRSQVMARIEQAKADIANSRVHVGYSRITAPVTGVVVKKFAETGSTASPGTPLLSIEDTSTYRLEVALEESRSKLAQIGKRVSIRIDALGRGELWGVVSEILPTADASTRTYTVKVNLPTDPNLRSGLYGLARFPVAQKDALTVPETALLERGQLVGVNVVGPDGIARFRIVTVGQHEDGEAEILSGLSEGDEIVVSGTEKVKDGEKVR